jgi:hypothetical protein
MAALALLFCVRQTTTVLARDVPGLNAAIPGALGSPHPPRGWIDGALQASGEDAGALESPLFGADASTVWLWVEFWNKSITRIYVPPGGHAYSHLPALTFALDERTGRVATPLEKPYLVVSASDPRLALQGSVFRRGLWGIQIMKPLRPYRAAWAFLNGVPSRELAGMGPAAGNQLSLAVYRPAGAGTGTAVSLDVRVTVAAEAASQVSVATGGHVTRVPLRGKDEATVSVPVTIPAGAPRTLLGFTASAGAFAARDVAVTQPR